MGLLVDLALSVRGRDGGDIQADSMTVAEETAIGEWLARIEETDPAIITYVVNSCRSDPGARAYFLRHAAGDYLH